MRATLMRYVSPLTVCVAMQVGTERLATSSSWTSAKRIGAWRSCTILRLPFLHRQYAPFTFTDIIARPLHAHLYVRPPSICYRPGPSCGVHMTLPVRVFSLPGQRKPPSADGALVRRKSEACTGRGAGGGCRRDATNAGSVQRGPRAVVLGFACTYAALLHHVPVPVTHWQYKLLTGPLHSRWCPSRAGALTRVRSNVCRRMPKVVPRQRGESVAKSSRPPFLCLT